MEVVILEFRVRPFPSCPSLALSLKPLEAHIRSDPRIFIPVSQIPFEARIFLKHGELFPHAASSIGDILMWKMPAGLRSGPGMLHAACSPRGTSWCIVLPQRTGPISIPLGPLPSFES